MTESWIRSEHAMPPFIPGHKPSYIYREGGQVMETSTSCFMDGLPCIAARTHHRCIVGRIKRPRARQSPHTDVSSS